MLKKSTNKSHQLTTFCNEWPELDFNKQIQTYNNDEITHFF